MSVRIYDAILGASVLKQCTAAELSSNNQIGMGRASGSVLPSAMFLESSAPKATWSTTDVAGALAAISATAGLNVTGGNGIVLPMRKLSDGGSYGASGSDVSLAATSGLIIPTSFQCQGKGAASLSLEAYLRSSDGHTTPVAYNTGVTLSANSFNKEHRLATMTRDGTAVAGLTGFTVNYGIKVIDNLEEDGFTYPTQFYIEQQDPTIDATFRNEAAISTFGPLFTAIGVNMVFRTRRKAAGGTVDATNESVHVTHTFAEGITSIERIANQATGQGEITLRFHGTGLTASTTSTLP